MPELRRRLVEMGAVVLAIDSSYDAITTAAFNYREEHVYPYLAEKGFVIERCQGKLARRHYVAPEARKPNVEYITGVGHGSERTFTGDQYTPIFRVGNYSQEESQGKIIHFLSCKTAVELGSDLVKNGCRAFFGYDVNFTIVLKRADIFFECDSEIDRAFADIKNAEEVYNRTKEFYETCIQEYSDKYIEALLNDEQPETVTLLEKTFSLLQLNLNHLCCPSVNERWGDPQAKLE
jgi:hypothetical protein